jgi:RNA polymerase sigma-70 factor (ECF subfamily)
MEKEIEFNLIQRSAQGNTEAFRTLVETNQAFAISLASRFMRDVSDAEDIVQEAFIRVWKNLNRYDFNFRFKTWLGKIVTNLCLDAGKSAKHRQTLSLDNAIPHPANENATNELEHDELRKIILHLAEQLTPKQQAVFVLRDLEQLEPDEVCQALDMSNGNMKSNLYYARLHIKTGLEKFYTTEVNK